MVTPRRYTRTFPSACTQTQYDLIEKEAANTKPYPVSMAEVLRRIVDRHYGLVDGEETKR